VKADIVQLQAAPLHSVQAGCKWQVSCCGTVWIKDMRLQLSPPSAHGRERTLLTMDSWLMRSPYFLAQGSGQREVVMIRPPAVVGITLRPRWSTVNAPTCCCGTTAVQHDTSLAAGVFATFQM
jgi:hypothetical protein